MIRARGQFGHQFRLFLLGAMGIGCDMFWQWLKNYLPRGLYGRAAMILILPVLTVQLLVSVVFIQRHFDGVTRSMTSAVAIELRYLQRVADQVADLGGARLAASAIGSELQIEATFPTKLPPVADSKRFDDLTGRSVISELHQELPRAIAVFLDQRSTVNLWLETAHGPLQLTFSRSRVSASNPHQLLVIMLVMGIIMTTIAYFFLRNQLRPIKRMAVAAADYGKGRLTPYTPTGAVEVRAAGMAFLEMRNRIERQTQSRIMMLSGVSHDLRTPLTRLRLGLSMLDGEDVAPLIGDVDDMQELLDGFLSFARDEANDALEPIHPKTLHESLIESANRAGQNVQSGGVTGPDIEVALRPQAIVRAVDNLIGNALRYGTTARLSLAVTDRAIRFVVQDDGPGIPAQDREAAMSPFVRLDPARNQNDGSGVGLGLAIVADIARAHGGLLRLGNSEELGGLKAEIVIAR